MQDSHPSANEHREVRLPDGRTVGLASYGGSAGGLPVLALHGAPACRLMFDVADGPARSLGLTLYCPDRPGYGLTPAAPDAPLDDHARDLEAIADLLGLDRFAVIGISGGAPYAVALAARLGSRVSGLALVSPMGPIADYMAAKAAGEAVPGHVASGHRMFFLQLPRHRLLLKTKSNISAMAFKAAPQSFAKMFARLLSGSDRQVLGQPFAHDSLVRMTLEALRQGTAGGMADLALFSRPWEVDFSKVTAPTAVWQGTADRIVPAAVSHWLAARLPNAKLDIIEGAGHFWVYGQVFAVLERLKLLAEQPIPQTGQS